MGVETRPYSDYYRSNGVDRETKEKKKGVNGKVNRDSRGNRKSFELIIHEYNTSSVGSDKGGGWVGVVEGRSPEKYRNPGRIIFTKNSQWRRGRSDVYTTKSVKSPKV